MRRGGSGKRRDAVEPAIIAALRAVGAEVWQVSGRGLPDLLIRHRGRLLAFEVKTGGGKQTTAQVDSGFEIVRSVEDALRRIGVSQ